MSDKNEYAKRMRKHVVSEPLSPPVVIGFPLCEPGYLTFGDFLLLPETQSLFGLDNDSTALLGKLVKDRDFMLLSASKHPENAATGRKLLAEFVRQAYIGDPRGVTYWRRVSKVLWVAYEG